MNLQLPRLLVIELIIIATGVIAYFAGIVLAYFATVSLILAFSILLTYALLPAVDLLDRLIPRGLAVLIVYVGLFAAIAGFIALVSSPLVHQAEQLARDYPKYADQFRAKAPQYQDDLKRFGINIDVRQEAAKATDRVKDAGAGVASRTGDIVATIFGTVSTIFLTLIVSLYFLLSGKELSTGLVSLFPRRRQRLVKKLAADYDHILGSFVRGHLLLSLIIGVVVASFSAVIGLPYFVLIGAVAAITSLIPVIGAFLGVVAPVTIAIFVNPILIPVFLVFFIILNEISDKVLYPRIVGRAVELHPLVVLFAVLIGVHTAGIAGALLATPLLALVKTTVVTLRNSSGYARA